ncbi:GAF domain-containing SpoIIE family protein phosphatase [Flammeovirga aprica]|uniref:GAF domain-containing protein n=1 Tax=Flammeovirga aprica JL-4 TaxID=694437 RepID=A0A7X9XAB8_9BACT|nr:GAF domain-containing protein [Flammeovirga aprica]NME69505.1 GAF domain-containing protein [Flammeovirga aprica JL-4]
MKTGILDQALTIYQDLSKELTLNGLCGKVIELAKSKTIAEKVAVIINDSGNFILKASGLRGKDDISFFESNHLAHADQLPLNVIKQLVSSKNPVAVDLSKVGDKIKADEYIKKSAPSFLNFIPLRVEEELIGFLMLEQTQEVNVTAESLKFIQVIAPQIAILIQNLSKSTPPATSNDKKASPKEGILSKEDLVTLGEIGQVIATTSSVGEMVETVYNKINSIVDAQFLDIGVLNKKEQRLEFPGSFEDGERLPFNFCSLKEENRLATLCFNTRRTVFINDFNKEITNYLPNYVNTAPRIGKKVQSIIYVPIMDKDSVIGVMTVQSSKTNAYTESDVYLVKSLSSYLAIAIDNFQLSKQSKVKDETHLITTKKQEEQLSRAYTTLKSLGEIGQDITSNLSIERIAYTAYESLNNLIDAPLFSIGIYNKDRAVMDIIANIENGEKLPPKAISLDDENKLSILCFKTLKEIVINDLISEYSQHLPNAKLNTDNPDSLPQSVIYLPLIGKEGTLGFITVQNYKLNAFADTDLNVLRNIAIYIGIALDNALTYEGLEEVVSERTAELQQQKNELEENKDKIEQSYKNVQLLSDIGLTLSSSLSTDSVIETVYENVNSLMDATTFGIGIYSHRKQHIEFIGAIEKGKRLPEFIHQMNDESKLSAICLRDNKEIVISDITAEMHNYINEGGKIEQTVGEMPYSIIYLPLRTKEKLIGVITVQSFKKNSYSDLQVNLLRNIAVLSAIAIDNAVQYEKIERQKEELQSTSQKITQSIKYAKQIQGAILPNRTYIKNILPDSFIFHKPKDIVSGDFFWFHESNKRVFVATVDCNSNGVPGAMMSIIGTSLFREIVEVRNITSPDEILDAMNERITVHLNQKINDNQDSLDISLCVIDKKNNTLEFAGANTSMARIIDGKFYIIKGTPASIGGNEEDETSFNKHTFSLDDDAEYFLFTDGYHKQIGGERKEAYGNERFMKMLFNNKGVDMSKKRTAVRRAFNDWMDDELVQTDDVLVLGFKANE